jgi:hypothetical protein
VTHVRACSKARWFPERIVWVWPREPSGRFSLRETKVVALDVDHRPHPEEFAVDLPAGAGVVNNAEKLTPFYLKQNEHVTADDLPRLLELSRTAHIPQTDTAIRPRSRFGWWRLASLGLLVGLVAVGAVWRARRRQLA